MGIPGAVDAAHALAAGSALRSWGDAIASSVDDLARGLNGVRPPSLQQGLDALAPVARDRIHATGWELRHAIAWRNDNRCLQRAAFGAMSLAERDAGGIAPAVGRLALDDAMSSAVVVAYDPTNFGGARFHAAAVARAGDEQLLVIDHLIADADDGVLALEDWMRRIGAGADRSTVVSPLREAPMSLRGGGPGIPVSAHARSGETWRREAGHLAASWQEAAERHLPAFDPVHPH